MTLWLTHMPFWDGFLQWQDNMKKASLLRQANLKLEKLRYLIRLAKDLKLINIKSYQFAAEAMDVTGRSIGGWLKYSTHEDIQATV